MRSSLGQLRRRELLLTYTVLVTVTLAAALVTKVGFAEQARRLLAVRFTAIPSTPGDALAIWAHNARSTIGVAVFAVVQPVSLKLLEGEQPVWRDRLLIVCDVIVACWAVGSSLIAGVLLGAYGTRQLASYLPDGPVEVTAWVLLVVLYIDLRRNRTSLREAAARLAGVLGLLAVAAVLELKAGV
jgi:hypothetical protein